MTSPEKEFFQLANMKPGDWVTRTLKIQNRNESSFTYNTEAKFLNGSKKLYNEFLLKVWDSKGILYDDKLHEFKGLNPRLLQSKHQEDLQFEVKFPYELGNEFQGLGFEFEFKFIVEDTITNPLPEPNPNPEGPLKPSHPIPPKELAKSPKEGQILPATATNMYNKMLIGVLLIISGGGLVVFLKRRKRYE